MKLTKIIKFIICNNKLGSNEENSKMNPSSVKPQSSNHRNDNDRTPPLSNLNFLITVMITTQDSGNIGAFKFKLYALFINGDNETVLYRQGFVI